jgi:hypothetical protein
MPTVVAGDPVGVAQVLAHTHTDCFLSAVKVHTSNQFARLEVRAQALFYTADQQHSFIHGQAFGRTGTDVPGVLFHGLNLGLVVTWLKEESLTHAFTNFNHGISLKAMIFLAPCHLRHILNLVCLIKATSLDQFVLDKTSINCYLLLIKKCRFFICKFCCSLMKHASRVPGPQPLKPPHPRGFQSTQFVINSIRATRIALVKNVNSCCSFVVRPDRGELMVFGTSWVNNPTRAGGNGAGPQPLGMLWTVRSVTIIVTRDPFPAVCMGPGVLSEQKKITCRYGPNHPIEAQFQSQKVVPNHCLTTA